MKQYLETHAWPWVVAAIGGGVIIGKWPQIRNWLEGNVDQLSNGVGRHPERV